MSHLFPFSQSTIHSFRPPHGCPDCPWVVDSPTALALHRCEAHGKPCPLCPKEEEEGKVKEENGNGECVGVTVRNYWKMLWGVKPIHKHKTERLDCFNRTFLFAFEEKLLSLCC